MNEEEMKKLWLEQSSGVNMKAGLVEEIQGRLRALNKKIKWRDRLEIGVALLMTPFFLFIAVVVPFPLTKIGAVIVAMAMLLIVYVLKSNQKKHAALPLSLREQVEEELNFLKKQRYLLSNVLYWYLLPFFIGLSLFFFGMKRSYADFFLLEGIVVVVCAGIWYANKYAVEKEVRPSIQALQIFLDKLKAD